MVVGLLVEFLLVSVLVVASSPRGRGNQRMLLLSKRREGFHLLAPVRQRSRVKEEKRPRPQPGVPILRQREKGGLKGARLFSEAEGMEGIIGKESYDEEYEGEEGRPVPSLLSPPPAFSDLPTETDLPLPPQVASEEETEEAEADDLFVMRPEWISIQKNSDGLGGATVVDSAGRRVVSPRAQASLEYVRGFRQWCPYIVAHQHRIMVISFPGGLAEHPSFSLLIRDLEFLHSLQVKLVIVMGSDPQIIRRLSAEGLEVRRGAGGRLIVDREAIKIVQEQAGYARSQVEAAMARSSSFGGGTRVNVVSGNHFYSTRPFGVVDGVDFGYSGKIRKVEPEAIKRLLDQHEVVLLSTLGYAPTGEVYHIPAAELASGVASELNASKVIFMTNGDKLVDSRNGKAISTLRLPDAKNLCDFWHEENGRMIHGGHEGAGRGVASSLTDSLPHSPSSSSSGQTHPTHTSFSTHPQDKIRLVSRAAAGRKRRNKSKSRQTRVEAFLSSLPSATDSEEESLPLQSQTSGEEKTIGQGSGGGARSAQNTAERAGAGEAMGGSEVEEGEEEEERHDEEEDGRMLDFSDEDLSANILSLCRLSVKALENGVDRAHLVDPLEGALLQELYTRSVCLSVCHGLFLLVSSSTACPPLSLNSKRSFCDISVLFIASGVLFYGCEARSQRDNRRGIRSSLKTSRPVGASSTFSQVLPFDTLFSSFVRFSRCFFGPL
uniref:Aspartate/glutamate/uridylate kinase domain-containing protein n=1 Tax=Chromera velia CCMP2878 TaxID=1169474 RepID=A0A0G4F1W8_9ALVE|eukprot:Cvel_14717.t1-p1 / transcript=Cvel_14717.t1 / gene=Cvel_14717 / organism=Chromera_velia_CCMP2878 / gene_product=Amino-acid acetyltransferase, putative / transcript_product=Amino-acid acetyltransferase, putative / location=Cvel_scaffold1058:217-6002(-) / protein_length=718 / sequence_SO=supercontig / SO=protein_coding / is_pseudo=false